MIILVLFFKVDCKDKYMVLKQGMLGSYLCVLLILVVASGSSKAFLLKQVLPSRLQASHSNRVATSRCVATWSPIRTRISMLTHRQESTLLATEEEDEEDEDSEEEGPESTTQSAGDSTIPVIEFNEEPKISLIKEGIKFPTKLDGSNVRVGIIMGRWNADVIQGLYTVR